jgi:hypothetical protein
MTYALDHIDHGVPDLRMAVLPAGYERLLATGLPLAKDDVNRLVILRRAVAQTRDQR